VKSPFLSVEDISLDLDGKRVLDHVSFRMKEGDILGIIGRSGAGKTVLMHLIRGIEPPPSSGRILFHVSSCNRCGRVDLRSFAGGSCSSCSGTMVPADIDLWGDSGNGARERLRERTAIMFQRTFGLYGNDRVIENVMRALDDIGYSADDVVSRAADLVDRVRLSHRMMHIARDLSGGEKQRVVLARQLARDPFLLLADEPTGTLDPETAGLVHDLLLAAARTGRMGMIVTSHFTNVIESLADRTILLSEGRMVEEGKSREIISRFMVQPGEIEMPVREAGGKTILSARDVSKKYLSVDRGVVRAVQEVTFDVREGEIFGLVGQSGAGKTTLSRIAGGIIEPTSGELLIRIGDDWVDMTKPGIENRGRAKPYIGFLHQEYDLYPDQTVLDNLTDAIGLQYPRELGIRMAALCLRMAGFGDTAMHDILQKMPGQLSEGERHRVALAQVLIREPRLVILDEPTGTMDPLTKLEVRDSILHAREEMGETFVIVSHDIAFVKEICDRVALMRGGRIVKVGSPGEVLGREDPGASGGKNQAAVPEI
jgi:methyl coenzyme M reductase system, component A2